MLFFLMAIMPLPHISGAKIFPSQLQVRARRQSHIQKGVGDLVNSWALAEQTEKQNTYLCYGEKNLLRKQMLDSADHDILVKWNL